MKKSLLILPLLGSLIFTLPTYAQEDPAPEETQEEECPSYTIVTADQVLRANGAVNIRSETCVKEGNIVGSLTQGSEVRVVAVSGNWMKIEIDGEVKGWVSGEFLEDPNKVEAPDSNNESDPTDPVEETCSQEEAVDLENPVEMKVKEALNLRDGACTQGTEVLTVLQVGEIVKAVKKKGGWYNIHRDNGTAGWAYAEHLTEDLNYEPEVPKVEDGVSPFTDTKGTLYEDSIAALKDQGILKGNPDGSYGPYDRINRAAFTVIIVRALLEGEENIPDDYDTGCFPDVPSYQWYTKAICYAKDHDIVAGHPDGYFRPGDDIDLAAAAKIIVETFDIKRKESSAERQWFEPYIQAMSDLGAIAPTLDAPEEKVKREEMAAMIDVVLNQKILENSTEFEYFPKEEKNTSEEVDLEVTLTDVVAEPVDLKQCVADTTLDLNIDYNSIAQEVLDSINTSRQERGLDDLELSDVVNASAMRWAQNGEFDHSRTNGLTFDQYQKVIGVQSYDDFAERLAQRELSCEANGCTGADVLQKTEEIHALWLEQEPNEEGQRDDFDAAMGSEFNQFGFGFYLDGSSLLMVYQFAENAVGDEETLCEGLAQ